MHLGTLLFTRLKGAHVGSDELGNRYFIERRPAKNQRPKRWVMYAGEVEPSRVPPEWHGWLHYTRDDTPVEVAQPKFKWQKPPKANMSGTKEAYYPQGHVLNGCNRASNTSDYQSWTPN